MITETPAVPILLCIYSACLINYRSAYQLLPFASENLSWRFLHVDYYFNTMPLFVVFNMIGEIFSVTTKQLSAHISVAFRQPRTSTKHCQTYLKQVQMTFNKTILSFFAHSLFGFLGFCLVVNSRVFASGKSLDCQSLLTWQP